MDRLGDLSMGQNTKTAAASAGTTVKDIWRKHKLKLYRNQEKVNLTDG